MIRNKKIQYRLFFIIVFLVIATLLILNIAFSSTSKKKSKNDYSFKNSKSSGLIPGCSVAKTMTFDKLPVNKQCPPVNGNGTAAYTLFIRHCDRGYNTDPKAKPLAPATNCSVVNNGICFGCQHMDTAPGSCASNDCSDIGIKRSWALGKWINCFAQDKGIPVVAVASEIFEPGLSNQRPHTTASIIYESLMNLGQSPCWIVANKSNTDHAIKKYVYSGDTNNKIVVVVWNHGGLPGLIKDVTNFGVSWNDCCFDKVVVMDHKANKLTSYDAKSLEEADICGSPCKNDDKTMSTYVTSQGHTCSYAIFGDSTPCAIPGDSPIPNPIDSNCYLDNEDPFKDKCQKGTKCCDGVLCYNPTVNNFTCQKTCPNSIKPDCKKYPPNQACLPFC